VQSSYQRHTQKALVKTEDLYSIILYIFYVPAFKKTTDVNFKSLLTYLLHGTESFLRS